MKYIILILLLFICSCKDKQAWQYSDELEVIDMNGHYFSASQPNQIFYITLDPNDIQGESK